MGLLFQNLQDYSDKLALNYLRVSHLIKKRGTQPNKHWFNLVEREGNRCVENIIGVQKQIIKEHMKFRKLISGADVRIDKLRERHEIPVNSNKGRMIVADFNLILRKTDNNLKEFHKLLKDTAHREEAKNRDRFKKFLMNKKKEAELEKKTGEYVCGLYQKGTHYLEKLVREIIKGNLDFYKRSVFTDYFSLWAKYSTQLFMISIDLAFEIKRKYILLDKATNSNRFKKIVESLEHIENKLDEKAVDALHAKLFRLELKNYAA